MRKILLVLPAAALAVCLALAFGQQSPDRTCMGSARCIHSTLDKILDGDTLEVDGETVRLALVNTPEKDDPGYNAAISFLEQTCPIRSEVVVDEDDLQISRSHRRVVAVVYCRGDKIRNLNEALLESGHAQILPDFCADSEFSSEDWARFYGC